MRTRIGYCVRVWVDPGSETPMSGELRHAVSGPAADIERTATPGITGCERVPRQVFRPEIVIYFAGNDALAGEFNHKSISPESAPDIASAVILEFTSTRHGM